MRVFGATVFSVIAIGWGAAALAGEPMTDKGAEKLAAYQVCHPLADIDLGSAGSNAATECDGIVRSLDGQHVLDNLAIHCLEYTSTRADSHKYAGSCVQTDGDGDKLFMTYDGAQTGQVQWIGGTGKFKGVAGTGPLSVVVAPASGVHLYAYTLNYDMEWTRKAK